MALQSPIPDFAAARRAMIDSQLRPQGVTDPLVLEAMGEIERERYLPQSSQSAAYVDRAVPLGGDRFLAAPAALGQLLTQMMPQPGQRALVIGAGTGYSAAVLTRMGLDVIALESDAQLGSRARELGSTIVEGPLEQGHRKGAPYDQILIDGAVEFIPEAIIEQLADGGRLGGALSDRGVTRLIVGRKSGIAFGYLSIGDSGVPALPGFISAKAFTF